MKNDEWVIRAAFSFYLLVCTVGHSCHIKTKRAHQIQITHSKLQIVHIKYKSFTSNTNCSQQIHIAHIKY